MKTLLSPAEVKAHGFRGRCNITRPHVISLLPEYLRREYAERGWKKGYREIRGKRHGEFVNRECFLEPMCDGFETTDREAFERHMREVHGKTTVYGLAENWSKSIRAGWSSPRAKKEGSPLTKSLAAALEECPTCGLRAEVTDRLGSQRWWDEHLRGCAIAQGGAA